MNIKKDSYYPVDTVDRTEEYLEQLKTCRRVDDIMIFRGVECNSCGETHMAAIRPEDVTVTEWCHGCGTISQHILYTRVTDLQAWAAVILILLVIWAFILF